MDCFSCYFENKWGKPVAQRTNNKNLTMYCLYMYYDPIFLPQHSTKWSVCIVSILTQLIKINIYNCSANA